MKPSVCVLPLFLASCAAGGGLEPLRPMEILITGYGGAVTVERTGSLAYEHGCLSFVDDNAGPNLAPVWPVGTVFNGTSIIFHKPGKADQPIVLNQEFVLSGQPLTWPNVPGPRAPLFEHQCGGVPFAVADVKPAN